MDVVHCDVCDAFGTTQSVMPVCIVIGSVESVTRKGDLCSDCRNRVPIMELPLKEVSV